MPLSCLTTLILLEVLVGGQCQEFDELVVGDDRIEDCGGLGKWAFSELLFPELCFELLQLVGGEGAEEINCHLAAIVEDAKGVTESIARFASAKSRPWPRLPSGC